MLNNLGVGSCLLNNRVWRSSVEETVHDSTDRRGKAVLCGAEPEYSEVKQVYEWFFGQFEFEPGVEVGDSANPDLKTGDSFFRTDGGAKKFESNSKHSRTT